MKIKTQLQRRIFIHDHMVYLTLLYFQIKNNLQIYWSRVLNSALFLTDFRSRFTRLRRGLPAMLLVGMKVLKTIRLRGGKKTRHRA